MRGSQYARILKTMGEFIYCTRKISDYPTEIQLLNKQFSQKLKKSQKSMHKWRYEDVYLVEIIIFSSSVLSHSASVSRKILRHFMTKILGLLRNGFYVRISAVLIFLLFFFLNTLSMKYNF